MPRRGCLKFLQGVLSHKTNKIWGKKDLGYPPSLAGDLFYFFVLEKNEQWLEMARQLIRIFPKCLPYPPDKCHEKIPLESMGG